MQARVPWVKGLVQAVAFTGAVWLAYAMLTDKGTWQDNANCAAVMRYHHDGWDEWRYTTRAFEMAGKEMHASPVSRPVQEAVFAKVAAVYGRITTAEDPREPLEEFFSRCR